MPKRKKVRFRIGSMQSFKNYPTYDGDTYKAIRLVDREITIEPWKDDKLKVCLSTAYNKTLDSVTGKIGTGAGEVVADWVVQDFEEAKVVINKKCFVQGRVYELYIKEDEVISIRPD